MPSHMTPPDAEESMLWITRLLAWCASVDSAAIYALSNEVRDAAHIDAGMNLHEALQALCVDA